MNDVVNVDELTVKHLEVAQWALDGYPTPGIAQTMGIPEARVAKLLGEVYAKLGVKNRKELRAKYDQARWEDALGGASPASSSATATPGSLPITTQQRTATSED